MAFQAVSPFARAREFVLQAEDAVQAVRSELVMKQAVIDRLRNQFHHQDSQESTPASHEEDANGAELVKGIFSHADLEKFLVSPACAQITSFLDALNACARTMLRQSDCSPRPVSDPEDIDSILERALQLIEETPPEEIDPQRFGNKAFRKWHAKLVELVASREQESSAYLIRSFGDPNRLDYGTGHEAAFLMLMLVLFKRGKDTRLLRHFLDVTFKKYLQVVRRLRFIYRLEPAGSHGVWSLDDYHFLPFVFGSSQLSGGHTKPKDLLTSPTLAELTADSDYMSDALLDILKSKRGPFKEHSPLLHSLKTCATWEELNAGLIQMWRGEVLGKFPVAQHFLFGRTLPMTWEVSSQREMPGLIKPHGAIGNGNTDPLAKYFHVGPVSSSNMTQQQTQPHEEIEHVLEADGSGIEIAGWSIKSVSDAKISGEKEIAALVERFSNELDFPFPEMLFSNNHLTMAHKNIALEFMAGEALRGCKRSAADAEWDRRMIKVPMADKWLSKTDQDGNPIKTWRNDYDWTFTTRHLVKIVWMGDPDKSFHRTRTPRRIDYEKLKQREPILWSKEMVLFEDDLFDMGESKLSVKIRVMPSCWFVLARFYLRVDGSFLRCFDNRVFHVYGTKYILIEESERESDVSALGAVQSKDLIDANYVASILPLTKEPITWEIKL